MIASDQTYLFIYLLLFIYFSGLSIIRGQSVMPRGALRYPPQRPGLEKGRKNDSPAQLHHYFLLENH